MSRQDVQQSLFRRSSLLWIVIILAVILRIGASIYLGEELVGIQQQRIQDQVSYNALAISILKGQGFSFDRIWYPFTPANTPTAHWSFIYPPFLALVYAFFGFHPLIARLIQAVISGVISTLLFYLLGKSLFNERVGLIAAFLGAIYAYFVYHDAALMTESFFIIGVMACLLIALKISSIFNSNYQNKDDKSHVDGIRKTSGVRILNSPTIWWIILGVILGVTSLLRQTILIWIPFMFMWIYWRSSSAKRSAVLKGASVSIIVLFLFVLPWTIRNYIVYDAFLPLNSNAGYALYSANHPYHGTQFDQDYGADLPSDLIGMGLNEAQLNSALTRRGLEFVLKDPIRILLLSLDRIPIFFNFWYSSASNLSSNLMRVLSFGLYLPLFISGLVFSRSKWKKLSLLYLFILVFSLLHIFSWASIRYRLPIDAVLMAFAGLAIVEIVRWGKMKYTTISRKYGNSVPSTQLK
jgi:4-amino-4-deoxy-L-arabinose transferase-like glycosyltransferase